MPADEEGREADDDVDVTEDQGASSSNPEPDHELAPPAQQGRWNPVAKLFHKSFELAFGTAHMTLSAIGMLGGRLLPGSLLRGMGGATHLT
jgi:hypothetical protein